jgi:hypothetical protein
MAEVDAVMSERKAAAYIVALVFALPAVASVMLALLLLTPAPEPQPSLNFTTDETGEIQGVTRTPPPVQIITEDGRKVLIPSGD